MHFFPILLLSILLILISTCSSTLVNNSPTAAFDTNAYSELNAKAKASMRRLADILDFEMYQRRLSAAPDNSYYYQISPPHHQRISSLPLTIFPLPDKRLHRIGGNIVMGK
ncbi:Neuropeptide-Like Protein [Caenorhabditis elegans]|uniref:Neuropeptide-Like Protein n=1 Tax=Caenorhabditis elegans TaxID=6239 RepID=Q95ZJ6_CAEEL|nr:Neuropeptide-Like Protein [Caenorhabditis elegans]CAC42356.1 Neuropeptide-Like Protein [Caenorhabditis elegans]|eukprot:NP_507878.1 Neuropeptide-Like Protein [Caenorhabditis elegans]